jgi:hypothetical protein
LQWKAVYSKTTATQTNSFWNSFGTGDLLGGVAGTASVLATPPPAAAGHTGGSASPPVSPLEPPPPTAMHAKIATIKARQAALTAQIEQQKAQLLIIDQQHKELDHRSALLRLILYL